MKIKIESTISLKYFLINVDIFMVLLFILAIIIQSITSFQVTS